MEVSTYLIDATGVRLCGAAAEWARFSAKASGAKVHVIYDADADRPIYAAVTAAKINDITAAQAMPIEAGATYVFDLGYVDYRWWAKMNAAGCRIVTRFKANTPFACVAELAVSAGGAILSDRIGHLPARQAANRRNPFADPVREVRVRIETGKLLRILSNDLDASAEEIASLYKRRWAIELFFRWVKQTLKITRFLGRSENAVRIQIAVALIAFLLLRLAQATQKTAQTPLAFARLIRANLMHRRRLDRMLQTDPPPPLNPNQLALPWAETQPDSCGPTPPIVRPPTWACSTGAVWRPRSNVRNSVASQCRRTSPAATSPAAGFERASSTSSPSRNGASACSFAPSAGSGRRPRSRSPISPTTCEGCAGSKDVPRPHSTGLQPKTPAGSRPIHRNRQHRRR